MLFGNRFRAVKTITNALELEMKRNSKEEVSWPKLSFGHPNSSCYARSSVTITMLVPYGQLTDSMKHSEEYQPIVNLFLAFSRIANRSERHF